MASSVSSKIVLLSNATATGAAQNVRKSGLQLLSVSATWNGATAKLQVLGPDGAAWIDVASASFTANGAIGVYLPMGADVRMFVSGGPPAAMYANLELIG